MKTIIAGSRSINNYSMIENAIMGLQHTRITEVVSGGAIGVDILGEMFATVYNIPIKKFIPDWNTYGKGAGILRNIAMGDYADCLMAFWDGKSTGTRHMITYAKSKGIKTYVFDKEGKLMHESTDISTK